MATMPVGWFGRETYQILASYCRHVCRGRWLADKINTGQDKLLKAENGVHLLDKLFGMAEREARAVLAHAQASADAAEQVRRQGRCASRCGRFQRKLLRHGHGGR